MESSGPLDRPALGLAVLCVALAAFSALVVVLGYRAYRNAYTRRGARKP